uniref:Protein kinase domain-containing protein n=1 Tax=Oryza nivara TaxID=4536 RepID=A0A0E0HDD7_ORYNI
MRSKFLPTLLPAITVLLVMQAISRMTTVAVDQRSPRRRIALPGCPDKCGDISIPYPFGTKEGCYLDINFIVLCNLSTTPPATAAGTIILKGNGYYFGDQENPVGVQTNKSWWAVDLIDIDVTRGEVRVAVPVSSDCSTNESYHELSIFTQSLNFSTTFLFSATRNVLLGVGQSVRARIDGVMSGTNYSAACNSLFDTPAKAENGTCMGLGCCEAELAPELGMITVSMYKQSNSMWETFPCTYAMVVERSWYNFSLQDLYGYDVLDKKFPGGVPLVLDFAIRNESCPAEGKPLPTACRSSNSLCVNTTNGQGYVCKCQEGYEGNPYLPDGCQVSVGSGLLRCRLQPLLRCRKTAEQAARERWRERQTLMSVSFEMNNLRYEISTGIIGLTSIVVVVVLFKLLFDERRKTKEFFIKNGGPVLEKVDNIKIFKKEELKPIIQSCNVIGKGGFGEVYKGLIDDKLVAIKKSINVDKLQEKQFTNEIIIQSKVIHKNIIKLIGCCLEVDVPMLVYEFVPRGSLHDILHGTRKESLPLQKRLNIAAGAAEGLAYMHSKTSTTILHGDIKPGNILLDENFDPKISDFGISRLIAIDKTHTKCVIGDMCYMDPIYLQSGLLTKQSDVYSFGVVLLELLTRQKASSGEDTRLVTTFLDAYTEDHKGAIDLFDREILLEGDTEVFDNLAILVVDCLKLELERRPEMTDVEERLQTMKRSYVPKSISDASSSIDT